MTDRYKGFIIHLDDDIREDDCEQIITALRMVKRVRKVEPLVSNLSDDYIYYMRGRDEIIYKFMEFLKQLHKDNLIDLGK
jgi:hypothetical protein